MILRNFRVFIDSSYIATEQLKCIHLSLEIFARFHEPIKQGMLSTRKRFTLQIKQGMS